MRETKSYEDYFKYYGPSNIKYRFFRKIIKKYKQSGNLLDVGCAHGYFLKIVKKDFNCEGLEYNRSATKIARQITKCKIYNESIENAKKIKSNKYDIITCFDVLEHTTRPDIAISEIGRLLKKGGLVIISVPNTNSLGHKLKGKDWFGYMDKTHKSILSNEDWVRLFNKNKLKVIDVFYDGYFDIPYNRFPLILQKVYLIPGIFQYVTGIKIIPKNGENILYILKK